MKETFLRITVALVFLVMGYAVVLANDEERTGVSRSPVVIDRAYSTYTYTSPYRNELQYKMNCYGYAIHVYSRDTGNLSSPYKQQPGEFAVDNQTYQNLILEQYLAIHGTGATGTGILDYIEGRMFADFQTLNANTGTEWVIQATTVNASTPPGYRKIALTVGVGHDYHFYFRHNDGTWSHKTGEDPVTTLSIDTNVTITDNNISTCVAEGNYDDGVRYYLIGKSAISDYPHSDGHSSLKTSTVFSDRAGDTITKATQLSGSSCFGRFDYAMDTDYFELIPTTTATYHITTSLTSGTYDTDIVVFNSNNAVLASDYSVGNADIYITLSAGQKYYIKVMDANHSIVDYTLLYTHY
ncbi:MAG: hypothetical protein IKX10_10810 [Lachnospiraceae bacterium]|nr:hypothetical protein [Lachnospiraceae bacterium]